LAVVWVLVLNFEDIIAEAIFRATEDNSDIISLSLGEAPAFPIKITDFLWRQY
jgi:hypothetical protein